MRHPRSLVALAIVRDKPPSSHRSAIRSVAVFSVMKEREFGVRFALDHRLFDRGVARAEIIDGVATRIARGATVISRTPALSEHAWRHSVGDLQLLARQRPDLDIRSLRCRQSELDEVAAAYAIGWHNAAAHVAASPRSAVAGAQCLWLHFAWTQLRRTERVWLASAWEAWRALERARSVPD